MKHRRGYMLIELAAAIAAGSALTGVAVSVIYLLIEAERTCRDQFDQASAWARLSDEFRRDTRAATDLEVSAISGLRRQGGGGVTEPNWRFRFPGGRVVEYRLYPGRLRRSEEAGDRLVRRESFRLPRNAGAVIRRENVGRQTLLSLRIDQSGHRAPKPSWRPCRIDAVLAADHRFTPTEGP